MSGRLVSCHNSQDACLIDYGLWLWAWQASSCGHLPCSCAQPSLYIIPCPRSQTFNLMTFLQLGFSWRMCRKNCNCFTTVQK